MSTECAYVLAYAIIMLNTDAHNEIVHRKMTLKEFITNISHNNGGELIPVKLLEEMYVDVMALLCFPTLILILKISPYR